MIPNYYQTMVDLASTIERRDSNNLTSMTKKKKLIPPWKLYDALKPGTIILADISLHCYIYPKKTPNEDGRKVFNECCQLKDIDLIFCPQIYQITAHKIQIMDKSDQAVEP